MMRVNEAETKRLLEAVKPAKLVAATKYRKARRMWCYDLW